ncbi:MAG: ABC transporter ATP-binding protein [Eggerthellales bacterium]|nr:ABC transporter ATP-binding protein [Eggerthellales bacterium]
MLVSMRDICKEFPLGKDVVRILSHIDLDVSEGEYLAIMGPSGSGKTTLMNLIGCLDVATSGTYTLDGRDISGCNDNQLAEIRNKEVGFVFQTFHLLPNLTALENVALPLLYRGVKESERKRLARQTLESMGLGERCDHKPSQLSGGQCQRVAIARAMVGNPRLLLADEPTGALDSASGRQIMELFSQLHKEGVAIIMITHDAQIASWADRVVHIRDGRLYDEGSGPAAPEAATAPEAAAASEQAVEPATPEDGGDQHA